MSALTTRDALTKALQDAVENECPHEADEHAEGTCEVCDYAFALPDLLADALLASGAVVAADTLTDRYRAAAELVVQDVRAQRGDHIAGLVEDSFAAHFDRADVLTNRGGDRG